MSPEIRQVEHGSAEYEALCELRNQLLRVPLGLDLFDEPLQQESSQLHFGLFDRGAGRAAPLGCAVVVPIDHSSPDHRGETADCQVRQMAIDQRFQRQGLGRLLLEQTEKILTERGFRVVMLHARVPAIGFYEKLGYTVEGDEFVEVTIPHRRMVKRLASASVG